jgi:hypothetical protein
MYLCQVTAESMGWTGTGWTGVWGFGPLDAAKRFAKAWARREGVAVRIVDIDGKTVATVAR